MRPEFGRKLLWLLMLIGLQTCTIDVYDKHWKLAEDFFAEGQYQRAIEEYARVVNYGGKKPIAIQAQLRMATILKENLKDYPNSIRAYRELAKKSSDIEVKVQARWEIAKIYANRLERPQIAAREYQQLYRELAEFRREGPEILLDWGESLVDAAYYEEAAIRYEEFRSKYPGHIHAPRSLLAEAQALLAARSYNQAIEKFNEVVEKFSKKPEYVSMVGEAYYGLGSAWEERGDVAKALEAYRRGIPLYPNKEVIELKIDRVMKRRKERRI